MITRIVLYKANPSNPIAIGSIVQQAIGLLEIIPGVMAFHIGFPSGDKNRSVVDNDYDVGMSLSFRTKQDLRGYETCQLHKTWVDFVLNGWILEGSTSPDPKKEFVAHIMKGGKGKWVRDPKVTEDRVVWAGEKVIQFE